MLKRHALVLTEAAIFLLVLAVVALDEFMDLPHRYLGAPPAPHRVQEALVESAMILAAAAVVIAITVVLQRRVRRQEEFLRVCGWCRKVHDGGEWVTMEEYLARTNGLQSTHGICAECKEHLLDEMMRKKL